MIRRSHHVAPTTFKMTALRGRRDLDYSESFTPCLLMYVGAIHKSFYTPYG